MPRWVKRANQRFLYPHHFPNQIGKPLSGENVFFPYLFFSTGRTETVRNQQVGLVDAGNMRLFVYYCFYAKILRVLFYLPVFVIYLHMFCV